MIGYRINSWAYCIILLVFTCYSSIVISLMSVTIMSVIRPPVMLCCAMAGRDTSEQWAVWWNCFEVKRSIKVLLLQVLAQLSQRSFYNMPTSYSIVISHPSWINQITNQRHLCGACRMSQANWCLLLCYRYIYLASFLSLSGSHWCYSG